MQILVKLGAALTPIGNPSRSRGWVLAAGILGLISFAQVLVFCAASDALPTSAEWRWIAAARPGVLALRAGVDWPVYPGLLRLALGLGLEPRAAGLFVNALLAGLSTLLSFALVRCWYGPRAGLLAALIFLAFDATLIGQRTVSPDSALIVTLLGFSWALARARQSSPWPWTIVAGSFGGLGLLVDPRFALAALAPLLSAHCAPRDQRLGPHRLLTLSIVSAVIALPWYVTHWKGGLLLLETGSSLGIWEADLRLDGWSRIPNALGFVWTLLILPAVLGSLHRLSRHREPVLWIAAALVCLALSSPSSQMPAAWLMLLPAIAALLAAGLLAIPVATLRRAALGTAVILFVAQQAAIQGAPATDLLATLPPARRQDRFHVRSVAASIARERRLERTVLVTMPGFPAGDLENLSRWRGDRLDLRRPPAHFPIAHARHDHLRALDYLEADFLLLTDGEPMARDPDYFQQVLNSSLRSYARPFLGAFELALERSTPEGRIELWRRRRASTAYEVCRFLEAAVVIDADDRTAWAALAAVYRDRQRDALADGAGRAIAALNELEAGRSAQALEIWTELVRRHPGSIFTRISGEDLDRLRSL